VELSERRLRDGRVLPAQTRDVDPRRRVGALDRVQIVQVDVIRDGPLEPVQIAARLDDRPGALRRWLGERASAKPAERRVELRRGRGDQQQLGVAALDQTGLHRLEQLAVGRPCPDLVADVERRGEAVDARAVRRHDAQQTAAFFVA
jgi:hypothetical protein